MYEEESELKMKKEYTTKSKSNLNLRSFLHRKERRKGEASKTICLEPSSALLFWTVPLALYPIRRVV